jgi:hypothetical protein
MQQIHPANKESAKPQKQKHFEQCSSSYSARQSLLEPEHIEKMQDSKKLYLPEQSSEQPRKVLD